MNHFLILIGGPGLFKGCDKAHDQSWSNYIVPLQLAAQKNSYKKQVKETVHWVLYEPPYDKRWQDDSVITAEEKKQDDGYNLHSIRKAAADKVVQRGGSSYTHRIKTLAIENGITYKGIKKPADFWTYLASMPDASVTRVWYSGHASGNELMLSLTHDDACAPAAFVTDTIPLQHIAANKTLANKFAKSAGAVSKFYGCYTSRFAELWFQTFGVAAAGATNKIDFGVVNKPSNVVDIMERIEKTPTSLGNPDWKIFK